MGVEKESGVVVEKESGVDKETGGGDKESGGGENDFRALSWCQHCLYAHLLC